MKFAAIVLATAFLPGCHRFPEQAGFVVKNKPPNPKDVIEAVVASHSVPLSVSPTCTNVGTQADDKTIGAYLSGFLAALSNPAEKNSLETKVTEGRDPSGSATWRCELTVRHSAGDDEWGWGVRFDVGQSDGRVHPESFNCIGGG